MLTPTDADNIVYLTTPARAHQEAVKALRNIDARVDAAYARGRKEARKEARASAVKWVALAFGLGAVAGSLGMLLR